MANKYIVKLTNEFSAITGALRRVRAGLTIPVGGEGIEADLTKDQLAELHADQYVTVHDPKTGVVVLPTAEDQAVVPTSTEAEQAQQPEAKDQAEYVEEHKDPTEPTDAVPATDAKEKKAEAKPAKQAKKAS